MGKPTPIRGSLSDVRMIILIIRVLILKLLCQAGWDEFQYSSACCQVHVGICGYVLSR
jgi:hypothetical protein